MKRILINSLVALLVSAMMCGAAWAQATAQISGSVQDQSGAVLPGVEITATQTDTGISRSTVTNETGHYVLSKMDSCRDAFRFSKSVNPWRPGRVYRP